MARVVFVQQLYYELPAVMSLSAVLKQAGHEAQVVVGSGRWAARAVVAARPALVGLPLMTFQVPWARGFTRELRRQGLDVPIVAGGIHPTMCPEDRADLGLDAVCRGEGEQAVVDAVEALAAGRDLSGVENFSGPGFDNPMRPLIEDVDRLPFLDRSVYDPFLFFRHCRVRVVLASRGCPFDCPFCNNRHVRALYKGRGRWYRVQSPQRALDELEALKRDYAPAIFRFQDDLFGADPDWLSEFLEGYRRRGLDTPFQFQTRADLVPPEAIPELHRTGCAQIVVGLESGDESVRTGVLGKKIPDAAFERLAAACRQHGVGLGVNCMFGTPGETLDQALSTVAMMARLKPSRMFTDVLKFYPKLKITDRAVEMGVLDPRDVERLHESRFRSRRSLLEQPDIHAVENVHKFSYLGGRVPALLPVIERLVRLPPNPLFDGVFFASSLWEHARGDLFGNPVETALRLALNARTVI